MANEVGRRGIADLIRSAVHRYDQAHVAESEKTEYTPSKAVDMTDNLIGIIAFVGYLLCVIGLINPGWLVRDVLLATTCVHYSEFIREKVAEYFPQFKAYCQKTLIPMAKTFMTDLAKAQTKKAPEASKSPVTSEG